MPEKPFKSKTIYVPNWRLAMMNHIKNLSLLQGISESEIILDLIEKGLKADENQRASERS